MGYPSRRLVLACRMLLGPPRLAASRLRFDTPDLHPESDSRGCRSSTHSWIASPACSGPTIPFSLKSWTGQQILEAFPWEAPPTYLLRDRDRIYEGAFRKRVRATGVEEVLIAPRSPWQSSFVERLIGTIRRECLDHVIVIDERHLKRLLRNYLGYSWVADAPVV